MQYGLYPCHRLQDN